MPSSLVIRIRIGSVYPSWPGLSPPSTSFGAVTSKTWMPGTRPGMTKSLLPRLYSSCFLDHLPPAHVALQHVGHRDAPALLLVGLHHGDQGAADRDARAVERVHEARAPALRAAARIHAPRLEVAAVRAGRDLAVGPLPRQPHLDVVGLLRREAHVAGAPRHHAIVQTERA